MSRAFWTWAKSRQPVSNPETLFQVKAAANHPLVIRHIDVQPLGSTGASAPLIFEIHKQDDAGAGPAMADDSANIIKVPPAYAHTTQSTVFAGAAGTEPTQSSGSFRHRLTIHQQGTRPWIPPNERQEIFIPAGEIVGFKWVGAAPSFTVYWQIFAEE